MRRVKMTLLLAAFALCASAMAGEIHDAAAGGDLAAVKALIQANSELLTEVDTTGATPLHSAAMEGHREVAAFLLDQGADINAAKTNGARPLHSAAYGGHEAAVKLLLDRGADVNALTTRQGTVLHSAGAGGSVEIVRWLVARGLDVNALDQHNSTAILSAAISGHRDLVQHLLSIGADHTVRNSRDNSALMLAAYSGDVETFKLLLKQEGGDIHEISSCYNFTPLHWCAYRGHLELAEFLLDEGADVLRADQWGVTCVGKAVYAGQREILSLFLERGADINARSGEDQHSYLLEASWSGDTAMADFLVEHGLSVNAPNGAGETPLMAAAWENTALVKFYLDRGADVNAADTNGWTALHAASAHAELELVQALLDAGANVNAAHNDGVTPLIRASGNGPLETVNALLATGADVGATREDGRDALYLAIEDGKLDNARALLEAGAKPTSTDNRNGNTPVHAAALGGNVEVVRWLLEQDVDLDAVDSAGQTPLHLAARYGHREIAQALQTAGARADNVEENYGRPALLDKNLDRGEAIVWHLGHAGWAIKTANHFLIIDYFMKNTVPTEPSLANGNIDPAQLAGQNVAVFASHEHGDHYDTCIWAWRDQLPDITYSLGLVVEDVPEHIYTAPRIDTIVDGIEVTTITSNDAGVGYVFRMDGLTVFHAGDHANETMDFSGAFPAEIDHLAEKGLEVDIAFMGIVGCGFPDREAVVEGLFYTIDKLSPKAMIPQHAMNREHLYREFADEARERGITTPVPYVERAGDAIHYKGGLVL